MKYSQSKSVKACLAIYFAVLILFFLYLALFTDFTDFVMNGNTAASRDYTSGWKLESGEEVDINEIRAGDFDGGYRLYKTLPMKMDEEDAIYFSTSNMHFKIYVDEVCIYSFDTRENLTGMGDGISFHMIGLGVKDVGKTLIIEGESAFLDGTGGRVNDMQFGPEEQYRYYIIRSNWLGISLSLLLIIFGVVIIAFYFGMSNENIMMRPLWALGISAIMFGLYSVCDTGMPQLLTGVIYASRDIVYLILHLASFPLVFFINYITRSKRRIYLYLSFVITIASLGWLIISRYVFGTDMHQLVGFIFLTYAGQLLLMIIMLIDNEIYCRKKNISSRLKFFYIGVGIFVAASSADMIRYLISRKGSIGHGSFFRIGLVLFFIEMAFQIFDWWSTEKTSFERDRFINRLLQYVLDTKDPETRINKFLEYMCVELNAERAYVFEEMKDGTFDNTYEFCIEGVTPEIDNLKGLPYDGVVDVWYNEYEKGGHILIYDIEKYREVSENMYNVLKPQGINTLVTGPLMLDGKYIGFFGVDNLPAEMMKEISELIRLLTFFLSEIISQRDNNERLLKYSYHDALTGVGNRRAIKEFEADKLDTSKPYGFVMCDINGLKAVNDNEGHEAGDEMIKSVATCLVKVFGIDNVYRMGGDEFAVYVFEDSKSAIETRIREVRSMTSKNGVQVSIGYSYAEAGDADYEAHRIDADNKMYVEKRKYYGDQMR